MLDRRHAVAADQHGHHIKTHPRPRPTRISEPLHRQHPNPTLLRERHRLRRTPVPDTRASLHLHEHNPITGCRNNIQLAVPTTPIALDNLQTSINQELDSHILAPSSQRHIPRHHSPHHSHDRAPAPYENASQPTPSTHHHKTKPPKTNLLTTQNLWTTQNLHWLPSTGRPRGYFNRSVVLFDAGCRLGSVRRGSTRVVLSA